jgi:hypothetical protein
MSLQQRYQRLGRNDSWGASLRDTVLLIFGLPVALALGGMLFTSKELSPEQQAPQAARNARRGTLTATRRRGADEAMDAEETPTPTPRARQSRRPVYGEYEQ